MHVHHTCPIRVCTCQHTNAHAHVLEHVFAQHLRAICEYTNPQTHTRATRALQVSMFSPMCVMNLSLVSKLHITRVYTHVYQQVTCERHCNRWRYFNPPSTVNWLDPVQVQAVLSEGACLVETHHLDLSTQIHPGDVAVVILNIHVQHTLLVCTTNQSTPTHSYY